MKGRASVSVVIAAYDAERHLQSTLERALAQTVRPVEIIVVDDGSTDGTGRIAQQFGDPVRHIRQENAGVASARNKGVLAATGKWVAFLDADDHWMPEHLQRCMEVLESDPSLIWCCAAHIRVWLDGREVDPTKGGWMDLPTTKDQSVDLFDAYSAGAPIQTSGMVIRRDVLHDVGLFDANRRCGEDRDLWFRIAMRHPHMGFVWPPTLRYVISETSLTLHVVDATDRLLDFLACNVARLDSVESKKQQSFQRVLRRLARDVLWHGLNMARPDGLATLRRQYGWLLSPGERRLAVVGSLMPRTVLGALAAARRFVLRRKIRQADD